MPILPLDHPEPFAATLGVMLYPGTDDDSPKDTRNNNCYDFAVIRGLIM